MEKNLNKYEELLNKIRLKEGIQEIEEFYKVNKSEINLNQDDKDKRSLLINAVSCKHFDAVKFLINNGANIFKQNSVKHNFNHNIS